MAPTLPVGEPAAEGVALFLLSMLFMHRRIAIWLLMLPFCYLTNDSAVAQCEGDFDDDTVVEIPELIRAVGNALNGCPPVPPTPTWTVTATPSATNTPSATSSPSATPTATSTPSATSSPSATPTATSTPSATPSPSSTATATPLPRCGDGLADPEEPCDGADLNGRTCAEVGASFGTLSCSDKCAFDTSRCSDERWVDNGNGTITDHATGLIWEKKCSVCAALHDVDNRYPWQGSCSSAGGPCRTDTDCANGEICEADDDQGTGLTAFQWVDELNSNAFGDATDWRIPSIDELATLRDLTTFDPATHSPFQRNACPNLNDPACSRTFSSNYWSATTLAMDPGSAWDVNFDDGSIDSSGKSGTSYVRAVRTF